MNKKIVLGGIIISAIIISLSVLMIIWFNLINILLSEGNANKLSNHNQTTRISNIIRWSGGQAMLIAECANPSYIENTSDYIIEGKIEKTESKWNTERNFIYTYSDFTIEKYIKGGPLEYDKIQIVTEGGCVVGTCQGGEHSPVMDTGKKRLYLTESNGELRIHGCGGILEL